jgi:hypothetical protein
VSTPLKPRGAKKPKLVSPSDKHATSGNGATFLATNNFKIKQSLPRCCQIAVVRKGKIMERNYASTVQNTVGNYCISKRVHFCKI